jgi:hypothetical protein
VTQADVADVATSAASREVLTRAAERLDDGSDATDLSAVVTVVPAATSNGVTITATGTSADSALRTSEAVAAATVDALHERITTSAAGLANIDTGEFRTLVEQRARLLTSGVEPLVALGSSEPQQVAPTYQTIVAFGIVGLAAGTLLAVGVRLARPTVDEARVAQRLAERPAVSFGRHAASPAAIRLLRQLLDDRPEGSILVLPVGAEAEKPALAFADWSRQQSRDSTEAGRVVAAPEPAGAVLADRPGRDEVAAVLLVVPRSTTRRDLRDAMSLLDPWRRPDAIIVTT